MSLGTREDNEQEGIDEPTAELTLNLDQAIILHRALQSLSIDCSIRKQGLKNSRKETSNTKDLNEIREETRLVEFIEKKIPYLDEQLKTTIIYLQKEDDATIKGVIT